MALTCRTFFQVQSRTIISLPTNSALRAVMVLNNAKSDDPLGPQDVNGFYGPGTWAG